MQALIRPEDAIPVKMTNYGLIMYVPKAFIQEVAMGKRVHLLNFDMPYFMRTAICKAATEFRNAAAKELAESAGLDYTPLPKIRLNQIGLNRARVQLDTKEIVEIRKTAGGQASHVVNWIIKSRTLAKAMRDVGEDECMLYWGVGPATSSELNPLSDVFNMNCWLMTHVNYLEYIHATQGEVAFYKAMACRGMLSVQRKGGSTDAQTVTLNAVELIDKPVGFNVFDRLARYMFVNGMRMSQLQTQCLVIFTILLNYSTSMGNIRRALRGAVSAPNNLDEDTGELVIGETENTAIWWVPLAYYRRSPIAELAQTHHCRFASVFFADERIIWQNNIGDGIFMRNNHLDPNAIVCSLLGADSKATKVVQRHKLITGTRCEIVSDRGELLEEDSCVKLAIQGNAPIHTHDQLKYSVKGLGMYVIEGDDPVTLSTYLSAPVAESAEALTDDQLYQEFEAEVGDIAELELKPF